MSISCDDNITPRAPPLVIVLLVHFQNGPEFLTWGTAQVFILLMRFLLCSLVLSSFLVLFFFHLRIFDDVQYSQVCANFLFSERSDFFFFVSNGIRRDSVFVLRFPFLSPFQVLSCEISIQLFFFPFLFPCYRYSVLFLCCLY